MAQAMPPDLHVGVIAPRDAIEAFQRRKLLQPSFRWEDVWQEEHSRAFAVAGVQRLDVLKVFQDALDEKFASKSSLAEFAKTVRPQLAAKGFWGDVEVRDAETGEARITRFDDARLGLIYDVNSRQAYHSGQWERTQRNKKRMPFLLYRTMDDGRVRPEHASWNWLVLPVDHPFWRTHYPANGWRCRCKVFAIDQAGIDRLLAAGKPLKFEAPDIQLINYVNPRTGEVVAIPRGIDPGFAYNPGVARDEALHEQMLRKAWAAQPLAGAVAVAQATYARQEMVAQATEKFGAWVDGIAQQAQGGRVQLKGELQFINAIKPAAVRALQARRVPLATAAIAVRDADVVHALRPQKAATAAGVDISVYKRLPELLERATALLLEVGAEQQALLYVVDLLSDSGAAAKVVVKLDERQDMKIEGRRARVPLNVVRTVTVMDPQALSDRKRYELLWGKL